MTNTILKAIGSTYSVKEDLKSCGMVWNKEAKQFECEKESFNSDRWENKMCSQSWNGRKQGAQCQAIKIEEVK